MAGRVRGSGANYVQQTDVLLNLLNQRTKELQEQFQLSHSACLKLIQHNAELKVLLFIPSLFKIIINSDYLFY